MQNLGRFHLLDFFQPLIQLRGSVECDLGQFEVQIDFNNLIPHFWEKCEKCEKIKKDSENHSSETIDRTEFCLAPSERKKSALS